MLPNKMTISPKATKSLRRLQTKTGLTPNIGARIAFFYSIENGYQFSHSNNKVSEEGPTITNEKHTWLGEYSEIIEMLLKETYPNLTKQEIYKAWLSHIDDGSVEIENKKSLLNII